MTECDEGTIIKLKPVMRRSLCAGNSVGASQRWLTIVVVYYWAKELMHIRRCHMVVNGNTSS